jgi:hypothetical protein
MPSTLEFLPENVPKIFDMSNQNNANAPKHILLFTSTALPAHEAAVSALAEAYPSYKGDLINVVCGALESGVLEFSAAFSRKTLAFSSQASRKCCSILRTHP